MFFRGGYAISHPQGTSEKKTGFVCPNSACKRLLTTPLKVVNVGVEETSYDACPFCLSKISQNEKSIVLPPPKVSPARETEDPRQNVLSAKPVDCKKEFGYLGRRAEKEQIPDECLTCSAIVQCMRKPKLGENVGNS